MKAKRRLLWTHRTFLLYLPKYFSVFFGVFLFLSFWNRLDCFGVFSRPRSSPVCVWSSRCFTSSRPTLVEAAAKRRDHSFTYFMVFTSHIIQIFLQSLTSINVHYIHVMYRALKWSKIIKKNNNQTKALVCVLLKNMDQIGFCVHLECHGSMPANLIIVIFNLFFSHHHRDLNGLSCAV